MDTISRVIAYISDHKYVNLAVGIFLLYCGLNEAWGTIWQDIQSNNLGAHHGMIVFGLISAFKSFSHLKKGVQ